MARDFDGATQYGAYTVDVPKNGFPITLAIRFWPDNVVGFKALLELSDNGGGEFLQIGMDNDLVRSIAATGFVEAQAYTSKAVTTGAWNSAVAIFNSSTDRTVYANANFASGGSSTTATTPGTMTRIDLASYLGGTSTFFDGKLAEAAIWGVALTNNQIQQYHDGKSPLHIERRQLLAYWPLIGKFSPELDIMGGRSFTLTAAPTDFAHPLVIMLKKAKTFFASAGNQTYTAAINVTSPHTVTVVRKGLLNLPVTSPRTASIRRLTSLFRSAVAKAAATLTVQIPTITSIAINVTAVVAASISSQFSVGFRRFTGNAGLMYLGIKRRWDRRR